MNELSQIHRTSSSLRGRPNYVRAALILANRCCDLWELERPHDDYINLYPMECARYYWWRKDANGRRDSRITRNTTSPLGVPENHWKAEDRRACLSAICGMLTGKAYQALEIRVLLNISGGTQSLMSRLWREETVDYRSMIHCLHGDLGHRGLRELVLGLPGANYASRIYQTEYRGSGGEIPDASPGAGGGTRTQGE